MTARAAAITVTNGNDNGPGSLRQALTIANDGDTINFAVTGAITLTSGGLPITRTSPSRSGSQINSQLMAIRHYLVFGRLSPAEPPGSPV